MKVLLYILLFSLHLVANTMVYECDDNSSFVARLKNDVMWLFLPNESISLLHVKSASGATYTTNATTLFTKGEDAILTYHSKRLTCNNNAYEATWEKAKLDGYDFRAIGNEPAWNLVIAKESKSIFTYNYAQKQEVFILPPHKTKDRHTTYDINATFTIEIIAKECFDDMSGTPFESSAIITLNGYVYRGCGKALH